MGAVGRSCGARGSLLREQLDRLWTYKTPMGVGNFLIGWLKALRWQRLPEMERLGEFLVRHLEGIAAYGFHRARFGVVESINTTINAVLHRARGMRDEQLLLLKLKWPTAHPIRSSRDLARFMNLQPLYSNRVKNLHRTATRPRGDLRARKCCASLGHPFHDAGLSGEMQTPCVLSTRAGRE